MASSGCEAPRISDEEDERNCGSYDLVASPEVEEMEVDEEPLPHLRSIQVVENEHHDEAIDIPSTDDDDEGDEVASPTTKSFIETRVDGGASRHGLTTDSGFDAVSPDAKTAFARDAGSKSEVSVAARIFEDDDDDAYKNQTVPCQEFTAFREFSHIGTSTGSPPDVELKEIAAKKMEKRRKNEEMIGGRGQSLESPFLDVDESTYLADVSSPPLKFAPTRVENLPYDEVVPLESVIADAERSFQNETRNSTRKSSPDGRRTVTSAAKTRASEKKIVDNVFTAVLGNTIKSKALPSGYEKKKAGSERKVAKSVDVKNPGFPRKTNTVVTWTRTNVSNSTSPHHSSACSAATALEPSFTLGNLGPQLSVREDDVPLESVIVESPPASSALDSATNSKATLLELSSSYKSRNSFKNPIYDEALGGSGERPAEVNLSPVAPTAAAKASTAKLFMECKEAELKRFHLAGDKRRKLADAIGEEDPSKASELIGKKCTTQPSTQTHNTPSAVDGRINFACLKREEEEEITFAEGLRSQVRERAGETLRTLLPQLTKGMVSEPKQPDEDDDEVVPKESHGDSRASKKKKKKKKTHATPSDDQEFNGNALKVQKTVVTTSNPTAHSTNSNASAADKSLSSESDYEKSPPLITPVISAPLGTFHPCSLNGGASITSPLIGTNASPSLMTPSSLAMSNALSGTPFEGFDGFSSAHINAGSPTSEFSVSQASSASGSSVSRVNKRRQEKKKEKTIDIQKIPGYRGQEQVEDLLEFINSGDGPKTLGGSVVKQGSNSGVGTVPETTSSTISNNSKNSAIVSDLSKSTTINAKDKSRGSVYTNTCAEKSNRKNKRAKGKNVSGESEIESSNVETTKKSLENEQKENEASQRSSEMAPPRASRANASHNKTSPKHHRRNRSTGAVLSNDDGAHTGASGNAKEMTHVLGKQFGGSASELSKSSPAKKTPSSSVASPPPTARALQTASSSDKSLSSYESAVGEISSSSFAEDFYTYYDLEDLPLEKVPGLHEGEFTTVTGKKGKRSHAALGFVKYTGRDTDDVNKDSSLPAQATSISVGNRLSVDVPAVGERASSSPPCAAVGAQLSPAHFPALSRTVTDSTHGGSEGFECRRNSTGNLAKDSVMESAQATLNTSTIQISPARSGDVAPADPKTNDKIQAENIKTNRTAPSAISYASIAATKGEKKARSVRSPPLSTFDEALPSHNTPTVPIRPKRIGAAFESETNAKGVSSKTPSPIADFDVGQEQLLTEGATMVSDEETLVPSPPLLSPSAPSATVSSEMEPSSNLTKDETPLQIAAQRQFDGCLEKPSIENHSDVKMEVSKNNLQPKQVAVYFADFPRSSTSPDFAFSDSSSTAAFGVPGVSSDRSIKFKRKARGSSKKSKTPPSNIPASQVSPVNDVDNGLMSPTTPSSTAVKKPSSVVFLDRKDNDAVNLDGITFGFDLKELHTLPISPEISEDGEAVVGPSSCDMQEISPGESAVEAIPSPSVVADSAPLRAPLHFSEQNSSINTSSTEPMVTDHVSAGSDSIPSSESRAHAKTGCVPVSNAWPKPLLSSRPPDLPSHRLQTAVGVVENAANRFYDRPVKGEKRSNPYLAGSGSSGCGSVSVAKNQNPGDKGAKNRVKASVYVDYPSQRLHYDVRSFKERHNPPAGFEAANSAYYTVNAENHPGKVSSRNHHDVFRQASRLNDSRRSSAELGYRGSFNIGECANFMSKEWSKILNLIERDTGSVVWYETK